MKIAYSCNDAYVSQTGISMISVCENNQLVDELVFYLISKDILQDNITILQTICNKYNRILRVVNFSDIAFDLNISQIGRHIETIYSKVFFSRIDNLDKVIYLDSDTIVVRSLQSLWDMPLDNIYMGVVETFSKSKELLGLRKNDSFFNDGVALVNVNYCREQNLIEKVRKVIADFDGNPPVLSEGALNKVCKGNVKYISLRYNLMAGILYLALIDIDYLSSKLKYSKKDILDSCRNPVVIHYLSAFYNRPWTKKCTHPYKEEYLKYKAISPWQNEPLKNGNLSLRIRFIDWLIRLLGPEIFDKIRNVKK